MFFYSVIVAVLFIALLCLFFSLRDHKNLMGFAGIFVCLVALGGYFFLGAPLQYLRYTQAEASKAKLRQALSEYHGTQSVIAAMEARLKEAPDAHGYFLLGRLYYTNQRYAEAAGAFKHALALQPGETQTLYHYALARYQQAGQQETPEVRKIMAQVKKTIAAQTPVQARE